MPLVKVNDLLKHATENHYGVPAVNQFTFETIKYAIKAAEIERLPDKIPAINLPTHKSTLQTIPTFPANFPYVERTDGFSVSP